MKQRKWLAAVAGGGLVFLSFPEINLTFLVAIAYVPYLWLINRCRSAKETFGYTWLYSFVATLGGFFWIAHTAVEFGGLPDAIAIVVLLLFAAIGSINLAVAGFIIALLKKRVGMRWQMLWVTAVFILAEAYVPKIFQWYAGNAVYQVLPVIQIADLGGPLIVSTLIIWINYAVFALLDRYVFPVLPPLAANYQRIFTGGQARFNMIFGAGMLLVSLFYGFVRLNDVEEHMAAAVKKNIAVVQGNLGNSERLKAQFGDGATIEKFFDVHRDLTLRIVRDASAQPDLVLWPEGAYPYPFPETHPHHQLLGELAATIGAPIVTGGYARQRRPVYKIYNAMSLIEPGQSSASAIYKKHILLAFGEYMPFADIFPVLQDLVPAVSDFGAGAGAEIIDYKEFRIASLICYEALSPEYMRTYSQQGANIILNVTNDSWYGRLQEPEQHLALSQLRCVESRNVQVRSTNTGISAVIWPTGEITHRTKLDVATAFVAEVPLMEMPETIYTRFGNWWPLAMLLVLAMVILIDLYKKRHV